MIWNTVESAPREEIEAIQLRRLRETARRVYAINPFYRISAPWRICGGFLLPASRTYGTTTPSGSSASP